MAPPFFRLREINDAHFNYEQISCVMARRMTERIPFRSGVTLVGGGPFSARSLRAAMALAPHPVAADGGADALAAHGVVPEVVIGDMDSLRGPLPDTVRLHPVTEQDSTDFGKCLAHTAAPFYIGLGLLGGRLDHTLAALSIMLEYSGQRIVLLGEEDVAFIAPADWSARVEPGTRVSFFPLRPCRGVASSGLRWSVTGLEMAAGGQIGTSNEATDALISARFEPPVAVTILPARYLETVVASLATP